MAYTTLVKLMNKDGFAKQRRPLARQSVDGFMRAALPVSAAPKPLSVQPAVPAPSVGSSVAAQPLPRPEINRFPLPRYQAPPRPARIIKKHLSKRALLLRSAGLLLAVFLLSGGFLAWKGYSKFHQVFHGTSTVAALSGKKVAPSLLKGEGDGRVNILLLGIGGPGHDGPDLTDTMVVLSVDPVNDTATMLSIPRDLWVKMPVNYFGSSQKINAAFESGKYGYLGKMDDSNTNANAVEAGFAADDEVIKQVMDININYHVLVNFQAFRQAIDTVGGVTVDVPAQLYDPTMAWENGWNPVLAQPGVQQMNGAQALLYARSRETSSDFARTERQRQILVGLKDKVLTAGTLSNPAKIDGLMNAFGDNVFSDLSTQGALRLVSIMKKVGDSKINSLDLATPPHQLVTTDQVGDMSVVRPLAGFNDYSAIQDYVHSQLPDGYLLKERAAIDVLGPTTPSAAATAATLKGYGYNVVSTEATQQMVSAPIVVDLSHGRDPYTRHYLANRFGVTPVTELPAGVTVADKTAKFVIISP